MSKLVDLDKHFSTTHALQIEKIATPLIKNFGVKYFRYLKLYPDKSRIILSNSTDCIRFIYENGTYKKMWFDGEFSEHLTEGYHLWNTPPNVQKTAFEKEINKILGLYHGITLVIPRGNFWDIYTFDSDKPDIYHIDRKIFKRFIFYFREQAAKLLAQSEYEKIILPGEQKRIEVYQHENRDKITNFLAQTRINRYYLSGKYSDVYLTPKETQCVYWLIQGKSAEEIAMIEGNGLKTIQHHLENIRRKLRCYKQTQIVQILLDNELLDILAF